MSLFLLRNDQQRQQQRHKKRDDSGIVAMPGNIVYYGFSHVVTSKSVALKILLQPNYGKIKAENVRNKKKSKGAKKGRVEQNEILGIGYGA